MRGRECFRSLNFWNVIEVQIFKICFKICFHVSTLSICSVSALVYNTFKFCGIRKMWIKILNRLVLFERVYRSWDLDQKARSEIAYLVFTLFFNLTVFDFFLTHICASVFQYEWIPLGMCSCVCGWRMYLTARLGWYVRDKIGWKWSAESESELFFKNRRLGQAWQSWSWRLMTGRPWIQLKVNQKFKFFIVLVVLLV